MIKEITTHFLPTFMPEEPNKQRYSLVVSLCTPDITVDLYSAIQTKIRSKVRITV